MPRLPESSGPLNRIAFFGPMASGKTFLARHLVNEYAYEKEGFADKLKLIARDLFGVTGKDGNDRIILQTLGDSMRFIDEDVWVRVLLSRLKTRIEERWAFKYPIVVDDLRRLNEAFYLRENGFTLILVDTQENIRAARMTTLYPNAAPEAVLHASERQYEGIVPDYTLNSNDITDLIRLDNLILNDRLQRRRNESRG